MFAKRMWNEEHTLEGKDAKQNVKLFIQRVEKEFVEVVGKYEKQVTQLKMQNARLRSQLDLVKLSNCKMGSAGDVSLSVNPRSRYGSVNKLTTENEHYSSIKGLTTDEDPHFDYSFKSYAPSFSCNSSKFSSRSTIKKNTQMSVLSSLQNKANNLEITEELLQHLGKNKKNYYLTTSRKEKKNKNEKLNTSLNSLEDSENNACQRQANREKSASRRKQKQKLLKKQEMESQSVDKDQINDSMKNVLKSMRNNIMTPQIDSSLSSKRQTTASKRKGENRPRVMFNPNSVDLSEISSKKWEQSPQKKPVSILKNSNSYLPNSSTRRSFQQE